MVWNECGEIGKTRSWKIKFVSVKKIRRKEREKCQFVTELAFLISGGFGLLFAIPDGCGLTVADGVQFTAEADRACWEHRLWPWTGLSKAAGGVAVYQGSGSGQSLSTRSLVTSLTPSPIPLVEPWFDDVPAGEGPNLWEPSQVVTITATRGEAVRGAQVGFHKGRK